MTTTDIWPAIPRGPSERRDTQNVNLTVAAGRSVSPRLTDEQSESVVGQKTIVVGTLRSRGTLRVHGSVQGTIVGEGAVYIEEQADIQADVSGAAVYVRGTVRGNVASEGRVEVTATGKVAGDITCGTLVTHEGAQVNGAVKVLDRLSAAGPSTSLSVVEAPVNQPEEDAAPSPPDSPDTAPQEN